MHFRLPKSTDGWRGFVGEIAIIVVGVLIALAAQQVVEGWGWQQKVAAAEQTMNEEIENSLLGVAELNRLAKCSTTQLQAMQDAIVRGDAVKAGQILHRGTAFGASRLWADNAFEATLSAQVSDHLGAAKLKSYSQVYQMIRKMRKKQEANEDAASDLGVLFFLPEFPFSPEQRYAQLRQVTDSRLWLMSMRDGGEPLARYAKKDLGLEVTPQEYLAAPGRADNLKQCEADAAAAAA